VVFAGAAVVGSALQAKAASTFPVGLIYTKEAPGRWAGKEGAHVPKVTVEGRKVKVLPFAGRLFTLLASTETRSQQPYLPV